MQAALTITYQPPAGATLTDPYWIRIEQVLPAPDRATVSQAAALLDRAFGLEVCEDGGEGQELVNLNEPALDEEAFKQATAEIIDLSYCTDGWDGSLEMSLKIIRSHPDLPYTVRLIGCEQTGPAVPTSGTASLIATTADTLTLEWPVVGDLQCEPAPVDRVGNTLRFAPDDQDATLRASWSTVYDLVPIRVPAAAFEDDRDLRALAFMHGMVADERISPDAPEEPDWSLCPTTDWQAPTDDQVTCYQIVRTHRLCSCSKTEIDVREIEEIVPCPEGIRCANNDTECMHLMGTVSQTEYVDCGPTDRTGTFDGDLADPNFYLEKCCAWPRVGLPQCARRTVTWRGGAQITHGAQHYRDLYGPATRIVPLSPPGGICGEWTIEQRIMGSNCCDGVEPLTWDHETSGEVVAPGGTVSVAIVGGGKYAYTWLVEGRGFHFGEHRKRLKDVSARTVTLFADPDACGSATITVTDGCSTTAGDVRCTAGRWARRGSFVPVRLYMPTGEELFDAAACGLHQGVLAAGQVYTDPGYGTPEVLGRWALTREKGTPGDLYADLLASTGNSVMYFDCIVCASPGSSGLLDPIAGVFAIRASVPDRCSWQNLNVPECGGAARYPVVYWYQAGLAVWEWIC